MSKLPTIVPFGTGFTGINPQKVSQLVVVALAVYLCLQEMKLVSRLRDETKDLLFLAARLVPYWPAPIHAVALLAYTVIT